MHNKLTISCSIQRRNGCYEYTCHLGYGCLRIVCFLFGLDARPIFFFTIFTTLGRGVMIQLLRELATYGEVR
jgi:hypothetical protein